MTLGLGWTFSRSPGMLQFSFSCAPAPRFWSWRRFFECSEMDSMSVAKTGASTTLQASAHKAHYLSPTCRHHTNLHPQVLHCLPSWEFLFDAGFTEPCWANCVTEFWKVGSIIARWSITFKWYHAFKDRTGAPLATLLLVLSQQIGTAWQSLCMFSTLILNFKGFDS